MRVLIVDDDPVTRTVLESRLVKWGYEVSAAADGEPAWVMVGEIGEPLLIIVDWMMPGLTGPQFCQRVYNRTDAGRFYMILFTSRTSMDDQTIGIVAGADAFLPKSLDFARLRHQLETGAGILEHRAQEAAAAGADREKQRRAGRDERSA